MKGIQAETKIDTNANSLGNMVKFCCLLVDRLYQGNCFNCYGWTYYCIGSFPESHLQVCEFILSQLEDTLNALEILNKSEPTTTLFFKQANRIVLLCLDFFYTQYVNENQENNIFELLDMLVHYQKIIFHQKNTDRQFLKCILHHLYTFLILSKSEKLRNRSLSIWKLYILQKPSSLADVLKENKGETGQIEYKDLVDGFSKILEMVSTINFIVLIFLVLGSQFILIVGKK